MYSSFTSVEFWASFIYFIFSVFVGFYIPGSFVIKDLNLTNLQKITLGTITGMVLWAWQGVFFGYLQIRHLTYLYLLIFIFLWLKKHFKLIKPNLFYKKIRISLIDWLIIILIISGSFIQLTTVWNTGIMSSDALYFCCGNEADALFYAALTKQIVNNFPPNQPGMYGEIVHNYHYWSNIVSAELIRIFNLPMLATQFQYMMVFLSLFLGLTVVTFCEIIKAKKIFIAWLIFFIYFGGDLIYLILHFYGTGINFSISSLEDGAKFLVNPPRAQSIVVFFAGLSFLAIWLKSKKFSTGIIMALVFSSLVGFKVYTGIFAFIGLIFLSIFFILKKQFSLLIPILITFILTMVVYLPVNKNSGGLIYTGLWRIENFRTISEFRLERLEYAKYIYYQHNNIPRIIQYEMIFALIFIVSTFGSKLLGLLQNRKSLSVLPINLHLFLIPAITINFIAGLFFIQTSGGANTFNFLVNVFIIGSIYTALTATFLSQISKYKVITIPLVLIIILLTIPRVTFETYINLKRIFHHEGFKITHAELEGYKYIRENTDRNSVILFDDREFEISIKSPYASIFTDRKIFLSGKGILQSHNIDTSKREAIQREIIEGNNPVSVLQKIKDNDINYIIMHKNTELNAEKVKKITKKVFSNEKIKILKPLIQKH